MSFKDNYKIANSCSLGLEIRMESGISNVKEVQAPFLGKQFLKKVFNPASSSVFDNRHSSEINRDKVNVRIVVNRSKNDMKQEKTSLSCLGFGRGFFINNRNN